MRISVTIALLHQLFVGRREKRMATTAKVRPWTKDDVRMLKTLAREKTKPIVIARKLKRTLGATYAKATALGVSVGISRTKNKTR
jgi:hypothetical protein